MRKKICEHIWNYDHSVYTSDVMPKKQHTIRRWCSSCGLIQHTHTSGRWYKSRVGPTKMFDTYPEGYELPKEDTIT